MRQISVYISAKLEHAHKLRKIQADGFHINARWIDMADAGRAKLKPVSHWQAENYNDIMASHFFLLYAEQSDDLKGSLQEIGYALCDQKKCWIAGSIEPPPDPEKWGIEVPVEGSDITVRVPNKGIMPWALQPQRIKIVPDIVTAFKQMRQYAMQDKVLDSNGNPLPDAVVF